MRAIDRSPLAELQMNAVRATVLSPDLLQVLRCKQHRDSSSGTKAIDQFYMHGDKGPVSEMPESIRT
jgi:hypothetical protein